MLNRKLASIQVVTSVIPLEESDNLDKVSVLGWQLICRRNEFREQDWCVYHEIDSMLPLDNPAYAFLKRKDTDTLHRLKSIKLRGALSQGLATPITVLDHLVPVTNLEIGLDVTEALGITLYESPIKFSAGRPRRVHTFPTHLVSKTDEVRIQSEPKLLEELANHPWAATVKYDGTSATYILYDRADAQEFLVCSRNQHIGSPLDTTYHESQEPENIYWKIALDYDIESKLKRLGLTNLALQGEIVGPGICGNRLKINRPELFIFSVWNIETMQYLSLSDELTLCELLGLKHVPVMAGSELFDKTLESLLALADSARYPNSDQAEGIVVRAEPPLYSERLRGRLSFKVISNSYLLKHGE